MNWLKISKTEEISEQTHNGKTYEEILRSLNKGERIASYQELQELRNNIYSLQVRHIEDKRFIDFWVFVPNPDKRSAKEYVAGFLANSAWALLDCGRGRSDSYVSLGVFLIRKIVKKKICSKCKQVKE